MTAKSCETCCYYIDHRMPDDDPDEVNGYCSYRLVHPDPNDPDTEYGGHWTHHQAVCEAWESAEKGARP